MSYSHLQLLILIKQGFSQVLIIEHNSYSNTNWNSCQSCGLLFLIGVFHYLALLPQNRAGPTTEKPSWHNKCMEMIIQVIYNRNLLKPWDRKLGQYSLLESFNCNPPVLLYNYWTSPYIDKPRNGLKQSAHVTLPMEVKKAIIHSLKTNGQRLTNRAASLERNGVENELSWTRRLQTQTHVILFWHIATSLCELNLSTQVIATGEQVNQQRESNDFIVATKLSKYCAYLVFFAA